jgi:hypothetical protein
MDMKMKTAEEIAFDLASAAIDMMTLHSPHTEQMMRDALERWKLWQIRSREIGRLRIPNTEEMVNRFLSWKLPESVMADQCACERTGSLRYGTNLLSADEAREMIYHLHRVSESQREAAGTADEKPDGQAENAATHAPGANEKPLK